MEIPDTPQALLVVVVTTYSTWHLRTTYVEGPAERRRLRQTAKSSSREDEIYDHIHWKTLSQGCLLPGDRGGFTFQLEGRTRVQTNDGSDWNSRMTDKSLAGRYLEAAFPRNLTLWGRIAFPRDSGSICYPAEHPITDLPYTVEATSQVKDR